MRAAGALALAFGISLILGPRVIRKLSAIGAGQIVRKTTRAGAISLHAMHGAKEGTPTMGGLLILFSLWVSVLIFGRLNSPLLLILMGVSLAFGILGAWDDYATIVKKNHLGLSPRGKLFWQSLFGLGLGLILWRGDWSVYYEQRDQAGYAYLLIPFLKNLYPALGFGFVILAIVVMTCTSNAVNLTDGLDGLAIGTTLATATALSVMAYLASRTDYSSYLFIPYIPGGGEIVVFGGALIGASLGFLWFNSHPAEIFMGDTGSMMLGGALGAMALLIKQELLLILIGGIFVIEALSVIAQVLSYKITGKRIFKMSPLHHHYEKLGIHESKIIIRFWTVSVLLALVGLATLKIR